jgi:hypothetical protein
MESPTPFTPVSSASPLTSVVNTRLFPIPTYPKRDSTPVQPQTMATPIDIYSSEWGMSPQRASSILAIAFEDPEMRNLHTKKTWQYASVQGEMESKYILRTIRYLSIPLICCAND